MPPIARDPILQVGKIICFSAGALHVVSATLFTLIVPMILARTAELTSFELWFASLQTLAEGLAFIAIGVLIQTVRELLQEPERTKTSH